VTRTEEHAPGRHVDLVGEPDRGVVLLWHGRGVDNRDAVRPLAQQIAAAGVLALAADWSSEAPDHGRSDLLTSVRHARVTAEHHGHDPSRLVVAGWSLGGTAAVGLAVHAKRLGIELGGVVLIAPGDGPRALDAISGAALPATFTDGAGRCRIDLLYGEHDELATPDLVSGLELRLRAASWSTSLHSIDADHGEVVGARYDERADRYVRSSQPRAIAAAGLTADAVVQVVTSSR